jgi:uncharacterized membrane protein YoaK (UPF0700 family)
MSFRELAVALLIAMACALAVRYAGRALLRRFDVRRPKVQLVAGLISAVAAGAIGGLLGATLPETSYFIAMPVILGIVVGGVSALASTVQSCGTEKQGEEESK